jgi:hypothetical protein
MRSNDHAKRFEGLRALARYHLDSGVPKHEVERLVQPLYLREYHGIANPSFSFTVVTVSPEVAPGPCLQVHFAGDRCVGHNEAKVIRAGDGHLTFHNIVQAGKVYYIDMKYLKLSASGAPEASPEVAPR